MRRTCHFTLLLILGLVATGCQGGALEYGGEVKDSPALETPPLESLSGEEGATKPQEAGPTENAGGVTEGGPVTPPATETPETGTVAEGGTTGETVTSTACTQNSDCPANHACTDGVCSFSGRDDGGIVRGATGSQHTGYNTRIDAAGRGEVRGDDDQRTTDRDGQAGDGRADSRGKACAKNAECMPGLCVGGVCQSAGDARQDAGRMDDGRADDGRVDDGRTDDGHATGDGARTADGSRVDDGRTDAGWTDEGDLSRKPTLRSPGTIDDALSGILGGGGVTTKGKPGDTADAPETGITITPKNFTAGDALETPVMAIVEDSSKEFFWIQIAAKVADGQGGWTDPLVMVQGDSPPDVSLTCKDFENGPLVTKAEVKAVPQQNTYTLVIGYKYPHYATMGHQPAVIEKALQCTMKVTAGGQTMTWPIALHLRGRAPLLNGKSGVVNTTIEPVGNGFQSFGTLYIHPAANGVGIASAAKDKIVEPLFVVSDVNQDATEAPFYTTCAPAAPAYSIIKKQADGSYHIRPTYVVDAIKPVDGTQHQCTVMVKDSEGNSGTLNLTLQWVIKPPAMKVTPEAKDEAVQPVPSPGPADTEKKEDLDNKLLWALMTLNIEPVNFNVTDTLWLKGDWPVSVVTASTDQSIQEWPVVRVTGTENAPTYWMCQKTGGVPFTGTFSKTATPEGGVGTYYYATITYDYYGVSDMAWVVTYKGKLSCVMEVSNGTETKALKVNLQLDPALAVTTEDPETKVKGKTSDGREGMFEWDD